MTEEIEGITAALDELLTALRSASERRSADRGPPVSARDSAMAIDWDASPAKRAAEDLIRDPVGTAIRKAITKLGERLHEIGGTQAMEDALYAAAELSPTDHDWRISVLDRRFDGIGSWAA